MATYYIATTGTDGAARTGSISQPWRTIEYAVTRLTTGDLVYIRGGTYSEVWDIVGYNGGAGYFTFQAYPGETPIFNGPGSAANSIDNSSYIKIIGLEITDYQFGCIIYNNANHILIKDCHIHDVTWSTLQIRNNASYVTVQNCVLHDTGHEGLYLGSSGETGNTNNCTVTGCTIYNTQDEAVEFKEGSHDCILENSEIYNAVNPGSSYSSGGGAVEINETDGDWGSNPNHIVRNCVIHDLPTNAYIAAAIRCATGCTVYNNVIYNIGGTKPGILINGGDTSYTRSVYHNTVDLADSRAIIRNAGAYDVQNNIGPSTTRFTSNRNLLTSDSYYVDKANGDYRILKGQAPLTTTSTDLRATVATDKMGATRADSTPTYGAYERGVIKAADANRAAVASAISSAAHGETVLIPSGAGTWSSAITIDRKALRIEGAGEGVTTIAITGSGIVDWYFPDNDYVSEVCHITFNMSGASAGIMVGSNDPHYGRPNGFRFHHLTFTNSACKSISIAQVCIGSGVNAQWLLSGLIDHCTFYDVSSGSNKQITIYGSSGSSASANDAHKALAYFPFGLGNQYPIYIEDCAFYYNNASDGAYDAYSGARYVFRYNTVVNTRAEHHGADSGGYRGTMQFEIYKNTFTSTPRQALHDFRSGAGVVWGNVATGDYYGPLLSNYRSDESVPTFGRCDGTSAWDGNAESNGYACLDQIGHVFGATSGGTNTLYPLYCWDNYLNGSLTLFSPDEGAGTHVHANRDYYNPTASFNGSFGCGWGLLANRPASGLTPGVGYFATDTNTLYRATGSATWETYYTPYTYPHPLRVDEVAAESGEEPPAEPPTGPIALTVR